MNPNIRVFNENLWAVNYSYVQAGYIKELTFNTVTPNDFITLTNDGKIVMNLADDAAMKYILPILRVVMGFPDALLGTDKGFMIYMKAAIPSLEKYDYPDLVQVLQKADVYATKRNGFNAACKWEIERRKLHKQFRRKNWMPLMMKRLKERKVNKDGNN